MYDDPNHGEEIDTQLVCMMISQPWWRNRHSVGMYDDLLTMVKK